MGSMASRAPVRSNVAVVGDSPYGVVCMTNWSLSTNVRKNGIGRAANVASLSVLMPHNSVVASAGGNLYVTRFRSEYTSFVSSPRKSCQLKYTSVLLDWHRATNRIGSSLNPPTPCEASRIATTVAESSIGFVVWLVRQSPSSTSGSGTDSDSGAGSTEVDPIGWTADRHR